MTFEVRVETDLKQVYRLIQRALQSYRDEKKGPTLLAVQSEYELSTLQTKMPELTDFPQVKIYVQVQLFICYITIKCTVTESIPER